MIWLSNSFDLNAIEPTWFYIKKEATKRRPTSNREKLRVRWEKCCQRMLFHRTAFVYRLAMYSVTELRAFHPCLNKIV